jgi:hypothetical protein
LPKNAQPSPLLQHIEPQQNCPLVQQVLPQTLLLGQHWPPAQLVPLAQQTVPEDVWQTWLLSQQALPPTAVTQVCPVLQHERPQTWPLEQH